MLRAALDRAPDHVTLPAAVPHRTDLRSNPTLKTKLSELRLRQSFRFFGEYLVSCHRSGTPQTGHNSLKRLADPIRFERTTSAFGGQSFMLETGGLGEIRSYNYLFFMGSC